MNEYYQYSEDKDVLSICYLNDQLISILYKNYFYN
jgi:hypothetical protein